MSPMFGSRTRRRAALCVLVATAFFAAVTTEGASALPAHGDSATRDQQVEAPPVRGAIATARTTAGRTALVFRSPRGVVAGTVLIAAVDAYVPSSSQIRPPLGWRLVRADSARVKTAMVTQAIYVRVAGVLEPGSYTWRLRTRAPAAGGILSYRGLDTAMPVRHSGRASRNSRLVGAPALNTPKSSLVVTFFGSTGTGSAAMPAGMLKRYEMSSAGGGRTVRVVAADALRAAAGSTGALSARFATQRAVSVGQMVALALLATEPRTPSDLPDTTAPSAPSGLVKTGDTGSGLTVAWSPSSDDVGVAGYSLYRNGVHAGTTSATTYSFIGLYCDTSHEVEVDAYDAAGNHSARASLRAECGGGGGSS